MVARKVCLGAIASPHGVRGMVRIKPFTEEAENIGAYGPVSLADGRRFSLSVRSVAKGMVLASLEGISSRDDAEGLKGELIYVDQDALPDPLAEEIYHADLIGRMLVDPSLGVIGRITGVYDFGAGSMLEVQRDKGRPVIIPFPETNPISPGMDDAGDEIVTLKVDPVWLEDGAGNG
ncbi:ribosome maturation factor RimM [Alphaproteobacteria bacterium LSUCC0684]